MSHNYYLYNDPGDNLLHWIPWDNNMALTSQGMMMGGVLSLELSESEVRDDWPLIRYMMDDEVYRSQYIAYVNEALSNVFYPERMQAIYNETYELIRPYVTGEEGEIEGYTFLQNAEAFDEALSYLISHVSERYEAASTFIQANQ
jgi:spore coat protein CotH